jgi:GDP-L-fucose synthase
MMKKNSKIYIAGHYGLVGSSFLRYFQKNNFNNIITRTKTQLNLEKQTDVSKFFSKEKPDYVFICAAMVGGILSNIQKQAEFITRNILIQTNIILSAHENNVKQVIFFGSNCIYPLKAKQPFKEESLLSGFLEPTNESYAVAKISGIKMIDAFNNQFKRNYLSIIPASMYGPNDNYNLNDGHVLASLVRKFYEAKLYKKKEIVLWGSGNVKREFLFSDELPDACMFLINNNYKNGTINVGTGTDVSIKQLANIISKISNFKGKVIFDKSKPDGMTRKILSSKKINNLGWHSKIKLEDGLDYTYNWFANNYHKSRL